MSKPTSILASVLLVSGLGCARSADDSGATAAITQANRRRCARAKADPEKVE